MPKRAAKEDVRICARCSNPFWLKRNNQKYCSECSQIVQLDQRKEGMILHKQKQCWSNSHGLYSKIIDGDLQRGKK